MTDKKEKNRIEWIDAVKGIGIILMVIGHSAPNEVIRHWIYGFHMPLFFVIAGFLFDKEKWESRGLTSLMKSRARSYLIPYCSFFIINLIVQSVISFLKGELSIRSYGTWMIWETVRKLGHDQPL